MRWIGAMTLVAYLLGASAAAVAADDSAGAQAAGDVQCSCRACDPEVCCTTPSGFAPLDQKCSGKCGTRRWTVKSHESCARPGCCPVKK